MIKWWLKSSILMVSLSLLEKCHPSDRYLTLEELKDQDNNANQDCSMVVKGETCPSSLKTPLLEGPTGKVVKLFPLLHPGIGTIP